MVTVRQLRWFQRDIRDIFPNNEIKLNEEICGDCNTDYFDDL